MSSKGANYQLLHFFLCLKHNGTFPAHLKAWHVLPFISLKRGFQVSNGSMKKDAGTRLHSFWKILVILVYDNQSVNT